MWGESVPAWDPSYRLGPAAPTVHQGTDPSSWCLKGALLYHQVWVWLNDTNCFEVRPSNSAITSGRVHPEVCWIDQPTSLPSGL